MPLSSRESYTLQQDGPRLPAVSSPDGVVVNPADKPNGVWYYPRVVNHYLHKPIQQVSM